MTYRTRLSIRFDGVAETEFMEGHAFQLVEQVRLRLAPMRREMPARGTLPVPCGPLFEYELGNELFLGRKGSGPLQITWDTNVLLDFFDHGEEILSGEPIRIEGSLGEELEALQILMALSMMRDIRFRISELTLKDSKAKLLSDTRVSDRQNALENFGAALSEADPVEVQSLDTALGQASDLKADLTMVPQGNDRALVHDAILAGQHVFLTRDRKISRARESLRLYGLVPASPQELLELLAASGSLFCLIDAECYLQWPLLDPHRVTHLVHSLTYDLCEKHKVPRTVFVQPGEEVPFANPAIPWLLTRIEEAALGGQQQVEDERS